MSSQIVSERSLQSRVRSLAWIVAVAVSLALPALAWAEGAGEAYQVKWHNGLHINSPDGKVKLKLGGRTYLDFAAISGSEGIKNGPGGTGTGVESRTARLYVAGTVYENLAYKSQFDFSGGAVTLKDLYIAIKHIPAIGTLKIGHFNEPFGLEEHTRRRSVTLRERAQPSSFAPSRTAGTAVGHHYLDQRLNVSVGGFHDYGKNGHSFAKEGAYNLTGRVTAAPVFADDGATAVHVGVSYSHQFRNPNGTQPHFKQKPESHLAEYFVDTGAIAADGVDLVGVELAGVLGPASLQGEYSLASVDPQSGSRALLQGFYVEGSVFLTGEHRNYVPKKGAFGRVKLQKHFDPKAGTWGAWQLAVRYSQLDLSDEGIAGGKAQDVTAGINWYLFPNMRLLANYVYSKASKKYDGHANIFQMRAQLDF